MSAVLGVLLAAAPGAAATAALAAVLGRVRGLPRERRALTLSGAICGWLVLVDLSVWMLTGGGYFWPAWTTLGFGALFGAHVWIERRERGLAARINALLRSRRGAVERQAAELKRVERDLHDGAQARLVSLSLTLGMAGGLLRHDPDAAAELVEEARAAAVAALADLRAVMHSIHPAVLADRGLLDAVRALTLDLAVPVTVAGAPPAGLPAAVETAAYFAVAECLANVVKHGGAGRASVTFATEADMLRIDVEDDGAGGADPARGTGLRGVAERLDGVDGSLRVHSPRGGPTRATIAIPLVPLTRD